MSDVKWIKITVDIFDDEKIQLIECLPEADSILVIWFKLLCLAGKTNNSGVFLLNDRIPYTDKMLATIFRRKESVVDLALKTFEEFGMVEIIDNVITIPNWGKHQNLDQLEQKKEYMRNYMRDYREKQKQIACKPNCKTNSKTNVSRTDKDIDKEVEIDKRNNNYGVQTIPEIVPDDIQPIIDKWNSVPCTINIERIAPGTHRWDETRIVLNMYGLDKVLKAIDKIAASEYLTARGRVAYDRFMNRDAIQNVLEGTYDKDLAKKDTVDDKIAKLMAM